MENRNKMLFEEYIALSNEVSTLEEQIHQKRAKMDSIMCEMTILMNQMLLNEKEKKNG